MTNETTNDFSRSINDLVSAIGKIGQMQVDIVSSVFKTVASAAEPLGKTAGDLAGNVTTTATQVLQNISSAVAPKK